MSVLNFSFPDFSVMIVIHLGFIVYRRDMLPVYLCYVICFAKISSANNNQYSTKLAGAQSKCRNMGKTYTGSE